MDIQKAAREFAQGEFPGLAFDCDREERYPMELVKKAADLGFIGINLPEAIPGPLPGINGTASFWWNATGKVSRPESSLTNWGFARRIPRN